MNESINLIVFLIDIRLITYTIFNTSLKAFPQESDLGLGVISIVLEKGHVLLDNKKFMQKLIFNYNVLSQGKLTYSVWLIDLLVAVPTSLAIWHTFGLKKTIRYLVGLILAFATQRAFISAMIRKIGPEQSTLADMLTLSRAASGAVLAGLTTSGIRNRKGFVGWIGLLMPLLGATATDWLDGPLARYAGPTRLGEVLDIEADSWLTLWSAVGAITWGELPAWSILPPLLRYLDPLHSLIHGNLPQGGGPWWCRVTGISQMGLFFVALTPIDFHKRKQILTVVALPVSSAQCGTVLILLFRKLREK
jgi:phosphatidylglycerophosphate synthase